MDLIFPRAASPSLLHTERASADTFDQQVHARTLMDNSPYSHVAAGTTTPELKNCGPAVVLSVEMAGWPHRPLFLSESPDFVVFITIHRRLTEADD